MDQKTPRSDPAPDADMAARLGLSGIVKGRFSRRQLIYGGVGLLVLLLVLRLVFGGGTRVEYVTQDVSRGPLTITVSATGTLAPRDQVDVGAEISGRIDEVYVDFNDRVKKGQKLARINTDQIQAQLAQARASLAQAQATLTQTSATIKRYRVLRKSNALSPQEVDNAEGEYGRAKAGVELARAQVRSDEATLSKATVFSPIDGVVLDRKIEPGQTVVAAMTTPVVFTLASDLSLMELDVDIDEADVGSVREGMQAIFTVDAYPARKFGAKLISLHSAPKTEQGVVTYRGVLLVQNPSLLLKPGMTATAEINAANLKDVLRVPNGALRFTPADDVVANSPPLKLGPNLGRVWLQDGSSIVPHDLKLGATNGQFTQVISGDLSEDDKVVVDTKSPDGEKSKSSSNSAR
ncbi:MAG: efflux RND transporter periplasmic adaptor subunit [Proteobacteria bacterium]|nr:efflux RND transporter periplasmic adaptor subunit [Pseudomonadota bacterium]